MALEMVQGHASPLLRNAVLPGDREAHGILVARCSCAPARPFTCGHAVTVIEHLLEWLPPRLPEQLRWLGVREADLAAAASRGERLRTAAAARLWSVAGYHGEPAGVAEAAAERLEPVPLTRLEPLPASGLVLGGRDAAAWMRELIEAAVDPEVPGLAGAGNQGPGPAAAAQGAGGPVGSCGRRKWCDVLGIAPPSPDDILRSGRSVNLHQLMVVALLERGTPATLEELAAQLRRAGAGRLTRHGDLEESIVKAWKGGLPIYRTLAGAYALDLYCTELRIVLRDLRVDVSPPGPQAIPDRGVDPAPVEPGPGPDVPLSEEEVDAALRGISLISFSLKRAVAALIDSAGRPLATPELVRRLKALNVFYLHEEKLLGMSGSDLLMSCEDGLLELVTEGEALAAMRKAVRSIGIPAMQRRRRAEEERLAFEAADRARAERVRVRALRPDPPRRAVVHFTGEPGAPLQVAVVDAASLQITLLENPDARSLRSALERFEEIAGHRVHGPAEWSGLVDERRCIELMPAGRTTRSRAGRAVALSLAKVCRASVNFRADPADPERAPFRARLAVDPERLTREALALTALLRYGLLHEGVRVARGATGAELPVWWPGKRDPRLREILELARDERRRLELSVVDRFEPWRPFARSWSATVLELDFRWVTLRTAEHAPPLALEIRDIVDVRWDRG
ncbi:MAG: hypothetical protein HY815_30635 [Candidatus Riflebacteria bacterium]|nr:hypothetical protein [Candidatus Riflebacteria bacterium]